MKSAMLLPFLTGLLVFSQQQKSIRPDTSTQRVVGQPPKLILALGDVSTSGNQHDSVSHALVTIEGLGLRAGLFDTLIRTDTQLVTKQAVSTLNGTLTFYRNLLDFDAVLLFTSGEPKLSAQQKADLLSFVHDDGKGLVVVHSAISSFESWPAYREMIGGSGAEPLGNSEENEVRVLAPDFPGMRLFPPLFRIRDKFFRVSIDRPERTRVIAKSTPDIPVAWTKSYGKGRVFVSQIGHDDAVWDRKDVEAMYLEAIQWVMHVTAPSKNKASSPATTRAITRKSGNR
jgi:type 1 glutamine amidotransferase